MLSLTVTLVVLALSWALAYVGAPLLVWTAVVTVAYAALLVAGLLGTVGAAILGVPLLLLLAFNIVPLRRGVLTRGLFERFKAVMPEMSQTERDALEAGDTWWETEMFRGRPNWKQLLDFPRTEYTEEEQAFLDNQCATLCAMINDWQIDFELREIPAPVMDYIREQRFLAMLIDKKHGGLGFSARAQSEVVTRIATRSIAVAVTVMVPNSLGPGELLMIYGTPEQKKQWLPGLVSGREIPCFGLTGPEAGSDATAMPDHGEVCYGELGGRRTLGIRLNFSKRWITLAPIATVVGLAFKLSDPEGLLGDKSRVDYGITCALVPANHPGVEIGRRHYPGSAFMNGPIFGKDVFVPLDWIIGGPANAGRGWRMLVECLSAGRGISLPALAAATAQTAYRMTGAYARIRTQFRLPVGKFEGVQEATGRIAGLTYLMEATRVLTSSAVDHCAPSVVTAIAKYHMTELMRRIVADAMDVHGGRSIQQGPRNYLASAYQAAPVAITVEGANILVRNLMIFGQGAIRCHPYVLKEMEASRHDDLEAFDQTLWAHLGYSINRAVRALTLGLTGAGLARAPLSGPLATYYRQLERLSAALAIVSDVTMGVLGGDLKRKERLSARLGDVLSHLYMASAVLKYHRDEGEPEEDLPYAHWALQHCLSQIEIAFEGFFANFPNRLAAALTRRLVFPLGRPHREPSDALTAELAEHMMHPGALRDRLSQSVYTAGGADDPVGRMERAFTLLHEAAAVTDLLDSAAQDGEAPGDTQAERLKNAIANGRVTAEQAQMLDDYEKARLDAIQTDDFSPDYLRRIAAVDTCEDSGARQQHVA